MSRSMCLWIVVALLTASADPSGAADRADAPVASPYGSLFRALGGERLEREHHITVLGFGQITGAWTNRDIATTRLLQGRGRSLGPQGGVIQDEGFNLNEIGLIACKGAGCLPSSRFAPNRYVLSRVTPLRARAAKNGSSTGT